MSNHPKQQPPGSEEEMEKKPAWHYRSLPSGRLLDRVAIITGADSGIGRAVAVAFAAEGARVAVSFLNESEDAILTKKAVEEYGQPCLLLPGDVGDQQHCIDIVSKTREKLGPITIVVNNAAEQTIQDDFTAISPEQLNNTFLTNFFSYFYLAQAAVSQFTGGSCIINTTSVTAYRGSEHLIDYASTKGAIVAFTRSLAKALASKHIRVNGVAPGPVWTPLIVSTFPSDQLGSFGKNVPLGRPGQPNEIAPAYVFLASDDASYMTGQILHPNGGEIING